MAGVSDEMIFPRSPRETMDGWVHLPRFVDKIRLRLAGKLAPEYEENFAKGFDERWLKAAGVEAAEIIEVVKNSPTDGQVCDWVRRRVRKSGDEKMDFAKWLLNRGRKEDEAAHARLEKRKRECNLSERVDVETFVDFIDADEGRI